MATAYPELVNGPFEVYLAPLATAFPVVNVAPAVAWVKIGTSGSKSISEAGIDMKFDQSVKIFRSLGNFGPRKGFRESEDVSLSFELADFSAEAYATVMGVDVTVVGGSPPTKTVPLAHGSTIKEVAMLIRGDGKSPYDANGVWGVQAEIPRVAQIGAPSAKIVKGDPIMWACEFRVFEDDTLGMGIFRYQTAAS